MGESPITIRRLSDEKKVAVWSIGIYSGETLFNLNPARESENPVISAGDITDIQAAFVADPFMIKANETWHMFFEVMNAETEKGEIGLAASADGIVWDYRRIVLREPFHLSYPYVFHATGEFYMVPESYEANSIRLYRADSFPDKWSLVENIMEGPWVDSSLFFFDGLWWIFASPVSPENNRLHLFYSASLRGPWSEHPKSPVIEGNNRIARPGGRVIAHDEKLIRFTQDCNPYYGTLVRAFEITRLTTTDYSERETTRSPILSAAKQGWNSSGMHHIDPHFADGRWIACVDGWRAESLDRQ